MPACCGPGTICQHHPKGMPEPRTYHQAIGFPEGVDLRPLRPMWLYYTRHAREAAEHEGLRLADLPVKLPESFSVVEVEVQGDQVQKWVLRENQVGYRGGNSIKEQYDLVLVVLLDGTVKTLWLNHTGDTHLTLRRDRYTIPGTEATQRPVARHGTGPAD